MLLLAGGPAGHRLVTDDNQAFQGIIVLSIKGFPGSVSSQEPDKALTVDFDGHQTDMQLSNIDPWSITDGWEAGITADRIKKALASFEADALPGGYYRLTRPMGDLQLIFDALDLKANLKLPTVSELRQLKYSFDKAQVIYL
ncbi:MAG: hypothetical protein ACOX2G_07815 [Bacillota bacterium]